jgi:hypothetical protein
MPLSSTDVIQSFRLRFWRESRRGGVEDWRGDVWHEQQERDDGAVVVANPEQAFDLVRHALQHFSGTLDGATHAAKPGKVPVQPDSVPGPPRRSRSIVAIWRKFWRMRR